MSTTQVSSIGIAGLALVVMAGCDPGAVEPRMIPGNPEPLALQVTMQSPGNAGPARSATIAAIPGGMVITGRRDAECNVKADGSMRRHGNELDIIAHVRHNGISSCAEVPVVLSYQGEVTGLSPGRYRVRLYETFMGGPARLKRSDAVTVPSSAP